MLKQTEIMKLAMEYVGVKELVRGKLNPTIEYLVYNVTGNHPEQNTAWCAAFVNSVLKRCGCEWLNTLSARECLKLGVESFAPQVGDIVVLWREDPSSWKGHVGFYVGTKYNQIYILGGNQNNTVSIKAFPITRLLGYRAAVASKLKAV